MKRLIPNSLSFYAVFLVSFFLLQKIFPQKENKTTTEEKDTVGKDIKVEVKNNGIKNLTKRIWTQRNFKIVLLSFLPAVGFTYFQPPIQSLLTDEVFNHLSNPEKLESDLGIVLKGVELEDLRNKAESVEKFLEKHNLIDETKGIQTILTNEKFNDQQKIELIALRLEWMVNSPYPGKKRYIFVAIFAIIVGVITSRVEGLRFLVKALRLLWEEGRITTALYNSLIHALATKFKKKAIPVSIPIKQLHELNS